MGKGHGKRRVAEATPEVVALEGTNSLALRLDKEPSPKALARRRLFFFKKDLVLALKPQAHVRIAARRSYTTTSNVD